MVFQCIIKLTMSFKTLLLMVIPKRYYCQSSCFSKKYQNGITFKANVSNNISKMVFSMYFQINDVCQNTASDSNTNAVLLSEAVFFKEILKWFYFQIQCFQIHIFKSVFQSNITLLLMVADGR